MKLKIEIEKRRGRNVHVILRGVAGNGTSYDNCRTFALYVELCKAFAGKHDPQPGAVFDTIKAVDRTLTTAVPS